MKIFRAEEPTMTIDEFLQPILNIQTPLKAEDSPETIEQWDSLAQINIIASLEDLIGEELNTNEVVSLTSVKAVVDICKAHGIDMIIP